MRGPEAYAEKLLPISPDEITPDGVSTWRQAYRSVGYGLYPQVPTAESLIVATTDQLAPFLPDAEYQKLLLDELQMLAENAQAHLARNVFFPASLRSVNLSRQEFFKGVALGDVVMHGENMIYRALHANNMTELSQTDRLSEVLTSLGVNADSIHPFRILNNISLEADSVPSVEKGGVTANLVAAAGYFPSGETLERCIFVEKMMSGTAMIFRGQKTILIGTGIHINIEGEEYDLAEQLRVLLHEGAHSEQSDMSQIAKEYSALEREISGITSIIMLSELDIAPYNWSGLLFWLDKIRSYSGTLKADLLGFLADPQPESKTKADHNIAAMEKENDAQARRLANQRKPIIYQNGFEKN